MAVATWVRSPKECPMGRGGSSVRKVGTIKESYLKNRHKVRECFVLRSWDTGTRGSGRVICPMAKAKRAGRGLGT